MLVLRLVFNGKVRRIDFGTTRTGDRTTKTGMVGDQISLAVTIAHFRHRLGADVVGTIKLNILAVPSRQCAYLINDIHQHLRTVRR